MRNYRFLIVGDNGVGKTTFINRLASGKFTNDENDEQVIKWQNDTVIHTTTTQDTIVNSDGLVLMFDIHNPKSFEHLEKYLRLDKPMVLVGNKCDIKYEETDINKSNDDDDDDDDYDNCKPTNFENRWYVKKWRELQQLNTKMKFYEISSKSNYNFDKPFNTLIAI